MRLPVDHFDLIARWYDRLIPGAPDDTLHLLAAARGQRVVDIGGGTGRVAERLRDAGVQVVVCDLSRGMALRARGKGLAVVVGSVDGLPLPDNSADRIVVVDAFHHFNRSTAQITQTDAVFEMLRVLKPQGRLVIVEPNMNRLPARLIAAGEAMLLMGSRLLRPEDIADMFRGAGARALTVDATGFSAQMVFTK